VICSLASSKKKLKYYHLRLFSNIDTHISIKTALLTFGEKYTEADVQQFFDIVPIEDGKFPAKHCSDMLTGKLKED